MKADTQSILNRYQSRNPFFRHLEEPFLTAFQILMDSYRQGGKLLICGNGGSAADADHITGEMLKGFHKKRPLPADIQARLSSYGETGGRLAGMLQGALPAVSLCAHTALITAVINDLDAEAVFAQQVLGFGRQGDVLLGISTSGNSADVLAAGLTAKALGLRTIALTGESGGKMNAVFECVLRAPSSVTSDIQDMHSVIYHLLCAMLESEFWDS